MAKLKLSELPRISSANPTDLVYVVQSNVSKSIFVTNLLNAAIVTSIAQSYISNNISTSNVAEGTNLYFTNARVFANVSTALRAGNGITVSNTTISANVISIAGKTGAVNLDTNDVSQTANLQYFNPYRGYLSLDLPNKYVLTAVGNTGYIVSGFVSNNPNIHIDSGKSIIFELFTFTQPIQILDSSGNLYNSIYHYDNINIASPTSFGANSQNKTTGILVINANDSLAGQYITYRSNANANISGTIFINNNDALRVTNTAVQSRLPVMLPNYTDAEVQSIAGANGMLVFNATNNKIQAYVSGIWIDLH